VDLLLIKPFERKVYIAMGVQSAILLMFGGLIPNKLINCINFDEKPSLRYD
jgi:hypothetical protein